MLASITPQSLSAPQSVVPIWSLSFNWLRDTWIVDSTENFISTSCYSTAGSDSGNYRTPPHQRPGHLFVFLKTWQQIQSYGCKMITKKPQTVTLYGLCSVSKALDLKHICTIFVYIDIDIWLWLLQNYFWISDHICVLFMFLNKLVLVYLYIFHVLVILDVLKARQWKTEKEKIVLRIFYSWIWLPIHC